MHYGAVQVSWAPTLAPLTSSYVVCPEAARKECSTARPPKTFRQGTSSSTASKCSQLCHALGPQHTAWRMHSRHSAVALGHVSCRPPRQDRAEAWPCPLGRLALCVLQNSGTKPRSRVSSCATGTRGCR